MQFWFSFDKFEIPNKKSPIAIEDYLTNLGRVTRFERANARFTAESVRPLHHTRHFGCLNILTISYDFVK